MINASDPSSTRFFNDSASALGRQFSVIFLNLQNAPLNRRRRVDECLSALLDLLVAHTKEIGEHEGLVDYIFQQIQETFNSSVDRGIEALRVVFDVQIGDRHEARSRFLNFVMQQAANSNNEEECAKVLREMGEALQENVRSTSDLLLKHLCRAIAMMKKGGSSQEKAVGCQIIATMVEASANVIRTNPALLETMNSSCQPSSLLKETIESSNLWHRKALVHLFTSIVEKQCIELSSSLGRQLSSILESYMGTSNEKGIIIGILAAIEMIATSPTLRSDHWPLKSIQSFLFERSWIGESVEVCSMVARTTAKSLLLFTKDLHKYNSAIKSLLSYISEGDNEMVALSALSAFDSIPMDSNFTPHVVSAFSAIRTFITKFSFHQEAFDTLEHLRSCYGDMCRVGIHSLFDSLIANFEYADQEKVSALFRFMGDDSHVRQENLKKLRISICPNDDVGDIIRSLLLITTRQSTNLLGEAVELMFHENLDVRQAAVQSVVSLCEILIRSTEAEENTNQIIHRLNNTVTEAVGKLLDVAVADRNAELRYQVLCQLSPLFDSYLSLPDHLDALFMAWNDVSRRARDRTLALLCRLHPWHPGIVHPQLLRLQEYMLREIEAKDGSMATTIYQASLLHMMADYGTLLLQPKTVELVVLSRLQKHPFVSKMLTITLLNLLKAVLDHTGSSSHCDAKELLQPVITIINGSTSSKRRKVAIETLCSILTNTITISDQSIYVDVYRALARIIRSEAEEDESVNYAAMKALSVIGATNPVKIRHIVKALEDDEIEKEEEVVTPALAHYKPRMRVQPQMEEQHPSIVLYLLVKTLQQSADAQQQIDAIATIYSMIKEIPGNEKATLLTQFLPQLQLWLAESEKAHLYEGILLLMTELATLLRQFKEIIPPTTGAELLKSVRIFCSLPQASQKPLNAGVVELLDVVARGLSAQEMQDHRWAVEFIHQRLSQDKGDLALVLRAVKSLESFLAVLHEKDVQVVLPHVLQCVEPADTMPSALRPKAKEINTVCFEFLNQIMVRQPSLVKDCCAEIVHTIMWYIEKSDSHEEMEMGLQTLAFLIEMVKRPAKRFIKPIERLAEQNGFSQNTFSDLLNSAAQGFLKVRVPAGKQDNFNPELPLSVISHLPGLSKRDFEEEMIKTLRLKLDDFEVMGVSHPSGQTVVHLRFLNGENSTFNFRSFTRKAQEIQSALRRNLGILKLEQNSTKSCTVDEALLLKITTIPEANKKKREQSWITWLHNTSVAMLKKSPVHALSCTSTLASNNIELSRDLFPFAAEAFIAQLTLPQRERVMEAFTLACLGSPNDIKQTLFGFAEFLESERGKKAAVLVKKVHIFDCFVERESAERKFGINYDQESRGIVVTKLEPNGPGASAGVPVGAILISINGVKVKTVSEILPIIKGFNRIELSLSSIIEERRAPEQKPLMGISTLARVALESQMHAKAVFFNEVLLDQLFSELGNQVSSGRQDSAVRHALSVAEPLIELYGHLGLTMVAKGLVKMMAAKFSGNVISPEQIGFDEVGSLEQLNWWREALARYESRMVSAEGNVDKSSLLGSLRCYDALGEIVTMQELIDMYWNQLDKEAKLEVTPFKAKAALYLGMWDDFDEFTENPEAIGRLGVLERCAALFRQKKHDFLLQCIEEHRESLFDSFSDCFMESYHRSYDTLLNLQLLRHFEELVSFVKSNADRRSMLQALWQKRLSNMSSRPAHLMKLVTINSLVLTPQEDFHSQVICIRALSKSHWTSLADHMLNMLLGPNRDCSALCRQDPDVIHVYMKHCYATGSKRETFRLLSGILTGVRVSPGDDRAEAWGGCWLLLGEWNMHLFPEQGEEAIEALKRATELGPKNYSAFHSLGILHYDLSRDPNISQELQTRLHIDSVIALFKSVQLFRTQSNAVIEDVLRILSIWFSHSTLKEVNEVIREGVNTVPDYIWLDVIPQLVARIGISAKLARSILAELLVRVGTKYPHALIYPLTVAEKSPEAVRRLMAEQVLTGIRVSNGPMVEEASLISNEMVRIAILWSEKWHSHIQRAAGKQDDAVSILQILDPLYELLDGANTPNERNFETTYGSTLRRARTALQNGLLDQAWPLLKQVYVQLNKTTGDRRLNLLNVSPTLSSISKSVVAVPGTFVLGQPLITIQKFHSHVYVMPSKQRPRRFGLDASDGRKYRFLLKGHEDLRQDERVMQFIALINSIFSSDSSASSIGLIIPQYTVIPLTDNVGIIGWVENTETIYKMIETRRHKHDISIYEEVQMIVSHCNLRNVEDYHQLSKQQRMNALSYVMANSPDDELRRIVWDKNDTCEQWLQYRGTYGHTLAIMSIVGYVLGLGDRHLNNLMLQDRGSVVHIDFGDCFEVAMHRQLYAEAVPFRLTRLLVSALGITGVDGVYRLTCELVMKNLRRHCENLLSILEAFIYDPLINWRLTTAGEGERSMSRTERTSVASNHLDLSEEKTDKPQMQMSFSVLKFRDLVHAATLDQINEEETRNQQGDLALARVRAKLTGEDFGPVNNSFFLQGSRRETHDNSCEASSWGSQSFVTSPKDSFCGPVLTTYLSLRAVNGGTNCLDVPHQVDRLIQEATSLDNLAEAYITGWAPFW